jgi:stage II sporulation SpoAA-like protein
MNAGRTGLFALGLLAIFLAAVGIGSAVEPADTGSGGEGHAMEEGVHGAHEETASQAPAGLAVSEGGYTLRLDRTYLRKGEPGELRLLFVLAEFDGLEPSAVPEDFKTGMRAWFRDHSAWKRFALVTDVEWVAKAMHMFAWLTPGEVLIRDLDGLEEAKRWVAA